ncbi:MAG: hypothetical protein WC028_24740 [Candidatus Obscuribacterales bacterium]
MPREIFADAKAEDNYRACLTEKAEGIYTTIPMSGAATQLGWAKRDCEKAATSDTNPTLHSPKHQNKFADQLTQTKYEACVAKGADNIFTAIPMSGAAVQLSDQLKTCQSAAAGKLPGATIGADGSIHYEKKKK